MNTCSSCQTEIDSFSQLCGSCARAGSMLPTNFYCVSCQRPVWHCSCSETNNEEKLPPRKAPEKRRLGYYEIKDNGDISYADDDTSHEDEDGSSHITEDVAMNEESEIPIKPSVKSGGVEISHQNNQK